MAQVLITTGVLRTLCPVAIVSKILLASSTDKSPREMYKKMISSVFSVAFRNLKAA